MEKRDLEYIIIFGFSYPILKYTNTTVVIV